MKIKVISQDRLVEIEVEGETLKDTWGPLAAIQEVLADTKCEACESTRVIFEMRTPQGYTTRAAISGAAASPALILTSTIPLTTIAERGTA